MKTARRRRIIYWLLALGLVLTYALLRGAEWISSAELHTAMESIATLLAAVVGAMALVRYWSRNDNMFLLIGIGFCGTAFFDGLHGIVTSTHILPQMPSNSTSVTSFSWLASRLFLAIMMFLSFFAYRREEHIAESGKSDPKVIYLLAMAFSLLSFLLLTLANLPLAYYPEFLIHRPQELLPALFFGMALFGYLKLGVWKHDAFNHWLVLFLIVSVVSQALVMPMSMDVHDLEFDLAHLAKNVSYVLIFIGLLINMYVTFVREKHAGERNQAIVDHIFDGIITIDSRGTIRSINHAVSNIFGYEEFEVVGRNISMLAASPHQEAHGNYLLEYLKTGTSNVIGHGREVEGVRQNGEVFPMELQITELWTAGSRMFVGVARDVSERNAADRMKTEFISTVSHELRTPLTAIRGSLGMIASGVITKPEQSERMLGLATKNTDRLIDLVNDLLDLEKMQMGKMEFHFQSLSLKVLLANAVEVNEPYATEKGVRLTLDDSLPDEAYIFADEQRLQQVLANLLSNAAKFSPENGVVKISAARKESGFRVSVIDHGSGIPVEFRNSIFDKFTQADSSDTRQQGGTGLGLNISKMIVEQHGGEIGFDSTPGEGATFYFDIAEYLERKLSDGEVEEVAARDDNTGRQRILILEDDAETARLISTELQQEGYLTDIARSAEEARSCFEHSHYDAMTVDIMLPDGNGVALVRELRDQEATRDLATIVVSIDADVRNDDLSTSALGIVDWLQKPLDQGRLARSVTNAVLNRQSSTAEGINRILYVEDELDLVGILTSSFGDSVEIVSATTLAEAKTLLDEQSFQLVILDVGLPDGSGLELLPLLKQRPGSSLPVIIYSAAYADKEIRDQVEAALVKSRSTNEDLIDTIRTLMPLPISSGGDEK